MKIRSGFVSNSSSSSFILAVTPATYEEVLKDLTPYQQAVAKAAFEDKEGFGQPLKVFGELTVQGESWLDELDIDYDQELTEEEYDEGISGAMEVINEKMKEKAGNNCFEFDIDG